jgi:hypothetical protein
MWIIEVRVQENFEKWNWKALRPTQGMPYSYSTKIEALKIRNMCYPDSTNDVVRVKEITESEYYSL